MSEEELLKYAENEADWLRYYGGRDAREKEDFVDANFYDRMVSIGYTKRVLPLPMRCARGYVTSDKPVLESTPEELNWTSGPRKHEQNVYTPLEYCIGTRMKIEELVRIIKK